jgi:hypothetical protein
MSEDPAILRQICFQPPYCPNENCRFHLLEKNPSLLSEIKRMRIHLNRPARFYRSKGWKPKLSHPFRVKRYVCLFCQKSFTYSAFKLDYHQKKPGLNAKIFNLFHIGASNREIARQIGTSEYLVRGRLKKLAQWALVRQTELLKNHLIDEPVVYDGLECFARSQFEPNNINQAIGKDSLFIFDFSFCPLNRKGKMSDRQKRIRDFQYETIGKYPTNAIRTSTSEIFRRIYEKRQNKNQPIILYSDQHYQYRRALKYDLKDCKFHHVTVSSKDYRNYKNILFPVNFADMLIRHHVAAFKRETIAFAKTHERMIQKFALYMCWKNFLRPQFVKKQKRNKKSNQQSPAMAIGIANKILKFHEFFDIKRTLKQVSLNREWESYYKEIPTYTRIRKNAA